MRTPKFLKQLLRRDSGFTLLDTVVALGILSLAVGLVGNTVFQSLSIQRYWQDDRVATKDLRHTGSWLAGDALNAESVTVGGTPPGSSATIEWTSKDGTDHTAIYSLSGDTFTRDFDGTVITLASGVVSVNFELDEDERVLDFTMTVEADRGTTEVITLQTYLRDFL